MIKVNGKEISKQEYDLSCKDAMMRTGLKTLSKEDKLAIANRLIDAVLLLEEARKSDVKVPEEDVDWAIEKIKSQFETKEQFEEAVSQSGNTVASLKEKVRDDMLLRRYIDEKYSAKIIIDDSQVNEYFTENRESFSKEETVTASHILFAPEDRLNADKVKKEIDKGADFEEMAKKHSKCPSGQRGGDLGEFGRGRMVKPFEDAAFEGTLNKVSEPVETQFGWHLIKVTSKSEGGEQKLEDVSDDIRNHLVNEQLTAVLDSKVAELRSASKIVIDEKQL